MAHTPRKETAYQRFKRHRAKRVSQGWKLVKVWVPTKEDAHDVQQLAAARRKIVEDKEKGQENADT